MSRLAKYQQTPVEEKRYSVEYSDWLDDGETIISADFTVSPTTSPPLLAAPSQIVTGDTGAATQVRFNLNGGVAGNDYTIIITVGTSGDQVKQDTILLSVRAI